MTNERIGLATAGQNKRKNHFPVLAPWSSRKKQQQTERRTSVQGPHRSSQTFHFSVKMWNLFSNRQTKLSSTGLEAGAVCVWKKRKAVTSRGEAHEAETRVGRGNRGMHARNGGKDCGVENQTSTHESSSVSTAHTRQGLRSRSRHVSPLPWY